jgi:hypothetical protein
MKVLVIGDRVWGRGPTLPEALEAVRKANGRKPREYIVYACHPDTRVDDMGYMRHPKGFEPKEIWRRVKAAKKREER